MVATILIVDDDPTQRRLMEATLVRLGFTVEQAESGPEAIERLGKDTAAKVDVMLLDLVMPDMDGMEVLAAIKPQHPTLPVIVLTAQSGIDVIVNVMRAGAADFIPKPASPERLRVSIENALKLRTLAGEVSRLTRRAEGAMTFDDLVGSSPAMEKAVALAKRAADSNIPILIEGESGVGKEMFARAIQGSSDRAGKPFVAVNCGAIPENLVESILFGHEKGAFTGASQKHIGKFQEADGGTLFLDEIGELRPDIQVKLLRAIQEQQVDPVGATMPISVDIRLISATNRDLPEMVAAGTFREDLFYRLNVFPLQIPSLRERPEDILPLVEHFMTQFAATEGKGVLGLTPDAAALLANYGWPGNVRQLENAIFRAVVLCDGDALRISDFPQIAQDLVAGPDEAPGSVLPIAANAVLAIGHADGQVSSHANGSALTDENGDIRPLAEVEEEMIRLAIETYNGRMSEVARRLGIGRSTLYRKVNELGLETREAS
jgi:DNA-binding NtrC family response regulator